MDGESRFSGGTRLFRSDDSDEVSAYCGDYFFRHRIAHLGSPRGFRFSLRDMPMGPVRIAEMAYDEAAALQLGGYQSSYAFILPVTGHVRFDHRRATVVADPETALIVGPREPFNLNYWSARTRVLLVSFDEETLAKETAAMLGAAVRGPVNFEPCARTAAPALAAWIELVRTVYRSKELVQQPFVSAALRDSILRGFLAATGHEHRDRMERATKITGPPAVHAAVEMIEQNAHLPLTPSLIAANGHIDVRTLHAAFRKHLATTPMEYLRRVRLQRIHTDLRDAKIADATVASIARRWGVTHLGRFSASYRSTFGRLPSETLRAERHD